MNTEVIWNFPSTQGADFGHQILGDIVATFGSAACPVPETPVVHRTV